MDKPNKNEHAKPRTLPHEPNHHFTRRGSVNGFNLPDWDKEGNQYLKRYGEPLVKGRQMFDGMYTPNSQRTPMFYQKYDESNAVGNDLIRELTTADEWSNIAARR